MIHYHGTPITPDDAAAKILRGRHGLVSFAHPEQITLVAEVCQSFVLDNGAFSAWKGKRPVSDWTEFYIFVDDWRRHPGFDWALIPDVIDGDEQANDALVTEWPFDKSISVPVWHMHESIDRLVVLADFWPRIAIGSSGIFAKVGSQPWWGRMVSAMDALCVDGAPRTKLHGLRMLNTSVFTRLPLASADSCNIGRNINLDSRWRTGSYKPATKAGRGIVIAERIEAAQSAAQWAGIVAA